MQEREKLKSIYGDNQGVHEEDIQNKGNKE
jgi:hypothetical protein